MYYLKVNIAKQLLKVYWANKLVKTYPVSTAKKGVGEKFGSEQTPRGLHLIRAKIGANQPANTVFRQRRPTGEICTKDLKHFNPNRDWVLTRIMWLSGLEIGKNRLGEVDTMQRYVYIHGTPDDVNLNIPGSKGCIRMRNSDIIELFDLIPVKTQLLIE